MSRRNRRRTPALPSTPSPQGQQQASQTPDRATPRDFRPAEPVSATPFLDSVEAEVPVPAVTAPRSMTWEESEHYTTQSPDEVIKIRDGDRFRKRVPTYSGPGTDMRGQNRDDRFIRSIMDEKNTFPTIIPDTHRELMSNVVPDAARTSLDQLGQDVHESFTTGTGLYNFDEYSMRMDQLPPGFATPEEFLQAFLRDPNRFANDQSFGPLSGGEKNPLGDFDNFNQFTLKKAGADQDMDLDSGGPEVGDWYHIDILGNDGDVMIVDAHDGEQRDSATVQTMTDDGEAQKLPRVLDPLRLLPHVDPTIDHPVSGRRQFGIEKLEDGGFRFYTRGFDRQTNLAMDAPQSNDMQHYDWSSLMEAMATEHGGQAERFDAQGQPMWGWAQQVSADTMLSSMVRDPIHNDQLRPDAQDIQVSPEMKEVLASLTPDDAFRRGSGEFARDAGILAEHDLDGGRADRFEGTEFRLERNRINLERCTGEWPREIENRRHFNAYTDRVLNQARGGRASGDLLSLENTPRPGITERFSAEELSTFMEALSGAEGSTNGSPDLDALLERLKAPDGFDPAGGAGDAYVAEIFSQRNARSNAAFDALPQKSQKEFVSRFIQANTGEEDGWDGMLMLMRIDDNEFIASQMTTMFKSYERQHPRRDPSEDLMNHVMRRGEQAGMSAAELQRFEVLSHIGRGY